MKFLCSLSAVKTDHDQALANIRALGFDAVDLILIPNWGITDPQELVTDFDSACDRVEQILEAHQLKAGAVNCAFSPQLFDREDDKVNAQRCDQVRAVCRFMKRLNIPLGAHYPGHIADWKEDPEGVWNGTVETLHEIQKIAKEEKVILAPELHFQTPFETPENSRRLLREIPGLPYTYEPSHYLVQKYDALETADLLDGAVNCHLRTCAPGELQAAPPAGLEVLDWMIECLKQRSYSGSVSIEYLPGAEFDVWDAIAELKKRYHG